ncbi:signal peptidase I [Floccifex sp.]|uniref:signal peptidase I n=1 Tax=Floccifex sp. TaxID=2815810 RepID=UPI003F1103A7
MNQSQALKQEIKDFVLKIGLLAIVFTVLFGFCFGFMANPDDSMSPAYCEGDLVFYYRLDRNYTANDTVVLKYNDRTIVRRVIAVEGDTVDINEDGNVLVNGFVQQESHVFTKTFPYKEGITFPVTLQEGEVFLLADNRDNAQDSRIFGPVKKSEIKGSVILVCRRRNL